MADEGVRLSEGVSIALGTMIQLDAGDGWPRLKTTLVGIDPPEYLMVKTDGWSPSRRFGDAVQVGSSLVARYLFGGRVFGFRCASLGVCATPRSVLFLSYPKDIQETNLRENEHVDCLLPTKVTLENTSREALILDINLKGCLCVIRGIRDDAVRTHFSRLNTNVKLAMQFPGVDGAVLTTGTIRNVSAAQAELRLGIVFDTTETEAADRVRDFLRSILLS